MDDGCGGPLTDTADDTCDGTAADDASCEVASSSDASYEDDRSDDGASDGASDGSDECGDEDDRADDACAEVRASDDGCEPAEEEPVDDDTLSAVPDTGADQGLADPGAVAPLVPVDIPVPDRVAAFEAIPGIGGDTAAVLGSVSGRLADAGRIAHAPLTGAGAAGIVGELARADTAGRAEAALSPLVAGEEMRSDVVSDELRRQSDFAARQAQGEAELVLERSRSVLGEP